MGEATDLPAIDPEPIELDPEPDPQAHHEQSERRKQRLRALPRIAFTLAALAIGASIAHDLRRQTAISQRQECYARRELLRQLGTDEIREPYATVRRCLGLQVNERRTSCVHFTFGESASGLERLGFRAGVTRGIGVYDISRTYDFDDELVLEVDDRVAEALVRYVDTDVVKDARITPLDDDERC